MINFHRLDTPRSNGQVRISKTIICEASINDTSKFRKTSLERPKTNLKARPAEYYHPLLQKEKDLDYTMRRILPKTIADSVRPRPQACANFFSL